MFHSLVRYALTAAVRDKLVIAMLVLLMLGAALAIFLGSAAIVEKDKFAVVFAAGGLRVLGVLGLMLFVVFFIRRSFEGRDIDYLLSRPVGRIEFLAAFAAAFSLLAVILGAAQGLCLYAIAPHLFGVGHLLWVLSVIIENIIMVNAALFFAMWMSSASTAAMVLVAFYVLARMMGQILGIIDTTSITHPATHIMTLAMQMVSAVTPRLDLMGQSGWLVYGLEGSGVSFAYVLVQGAVFSALVLMAAFIDLVKRQF